MNSFENLNANPITKGSYAAGTELNSIIYSMGGRYWVATALPYTVIGNLISTTQVKKKDSAISTEVVNRFLDPKHVKELKEYIVENKDSFTIPPITLVSKIKLPFKPVTFGNEKFKDEVEMYKIIDEVGSLMGKVTIPLGYTFTCLDGNHRTRAIADLALEDPDKVRGDNMLCNIVYETDNIRIRQDFVDINKNAKVTTSTINTLFNSRDPLSKITSQLIDSVPYLRNNTELLSASISKKSKKLYTLNNIKNAIVELSGHNSQSKPSIDKLSKLLGEDEEFKNNLLLEIDMFFDILKENDIIKGFIEDDKNKVDIRNSGLISTGIGLIIATRVINKAIESNKNIKFEEIVTSVIAYDWKRSNNFFVGKILSEDRTIMSSVNSIKATSDALFIKLFSQIK